MTPPTSCTIFRKTATSLLRWSFSPPSRCCSGTCCGCSCPRGIDGRIFDGAIWRRDRLLLVLRGMSFCMKRFRAFRQLFWVYATNCCHISQKTCRNLMHKVVSQAVIVKAQFFNSPLSFGRYIATGGFAFGR